jgi:hypothetical protein
MQPASSKKIQVALRQIATCQRRLRLHLPSSVLTSDTSLCLFHTRLSASTSRRPHQNVRSYVPVATGPGGSISRRGALPGTLSLPSRRRFPPLGGDGVAASAGGPVQPPCRSCIRARKAAIFLRGVGHPPCLCPSFPAVV